jgi:hypothetical protein
VRWFILIAGLELPATLALLDCVNRSADEFADGAADRGGWLRWLVVAWLTSVVGIGYGIVLGYYWAVVKRNTPARP